MVPQWLVYSRTRPAVMPNGERGFDTAHVLGGYRFLMENYKPGDRICVSSTRQTNVRPMTPFCRCLGSRVEVIPLEHWQVCSTQLGCCTKTTLSRLVLDPVMNRCQILL